MIGIIPAKRNSKGVPEKNIHTLAGKPLMWYAIQNAKKVCDQVYVISEDQEILNYAQNEGCEPYFENKKQGKDLTTMDELLLEVIPHIPGETFCILQPTSPTLTVDSVLKCYDKYLEGYDSVASVCDDTHIRVFEPQINRQQMEKKYKYTGGCVICSREALLVTGSRVGGKHGTVEIPAYEAIDIDNAEDFLLAESMLGQLNITIIYHKSKEIGSGHYRRALLLKKLFTGHKVTLVQRDKITYLDMQADIIIWDVLNIDTEQLNPFNAYTVTFENLGLWQGDLCINGIYPPTLSNAGYSGYYWMTINDDFIIKDCYKSDGKVIVAIGGTDHLGIAHNFQGELFDGSRPIQWDNTKYVICGAGNVAYEATARNLPMYIVAQNGREKTHECNYFYNNATSINADWNELHERAKMYDFKCNNHRVKNLILAKYNEWRLRHDNR